eukprot:2110449-Alexandrium_andersonii.AAC.1
MRCERRANGVRTIFVREWEWLFPRAARERNDVSDRFARTLFANGARPCSCEQATLRTDWGTK